MNLDRMILAWVACAEKATRDRKDQHVIDFYMGKARVAQLERDAQAFEAKAPA